MDCRGGPNFAVMTKMPCITDKNRRMSYTFSPLEDLASFSEILVKEIIMITILMNDSWADWSYDPTARDLFIKSLICRAPDISTATIGPPTQPWNSPQPTLPKR